MNNAGHWSHAMDITRVWNAVDIGKQSLRTVKMLASPLDPDAQQANDLELAKLKANGKMKKGVSGSGFATASTKNKNMGNDIHVNAQSYAIHLGADVQKSATILAVTRNVRGTGGTSWKYPGGTLKKGAATYPKALDVAKQGGLNFYGAGYFQPKQLKKAGPWRSCMANMPANAGTVALIDGSAESVNDTRLKEMVARHSMEKGGVTAGTSQNMTRPQPSKDQGSKTNY